MANSRKIKFRGKRIDDGKWVYGYLYVKKSGRYIILDKIDFESHFKGSASGSVEGIGIEVKPETVGQFTGLKDKNGREIYEGDIIRYKEYMAYKRWWNSESEISQIEKDFEEQKKSYTIKTAVVKFQNGEFTAGYNLGASTLANGEYIERGYDERFCCDYENKIWDIEVIGNVYDNPELLS